MTAVTGTTTATSTEDAVRGLAALLPGRVSTPADTDWADTHLAWARAVDQQPVAVVDITCADDVAITVRHAAQTGLSVSAQPVGHGATTRISGTVLLRTRGLQSITVDAERRVARVGAGVKWGELLAATAPYGLTGLAGSSADPSVVGFTVGGGLSWFSRAHGLAAHSVLAVDVVDATGTARCVSAESDPDLFWAICGGGGDFAIVTAIEFRLYPAPHIYGGRMMWPIEMAWPVLRAFRELTESAPEQLTAWAHLLRFPPLPELPPFLRGRSFVSVEATYLGAAEEAQALLAPLGEIPALHLNTMGTVPLEQLGGICAEPVDPMPTLDFSTMLSDLSDATLSAIFSVAGHEVQSPLMVVQLRHLGGALARGEGTDGPVGAIDAPYQLFSLGVPAAPELAAAIEASFAALKVALTDSSAGRTMFTFLGAGDDASGAFSPEALDRLRQIKRAADPAGVVRSNHPVLDRD